MPKSPDDHAELARTASWAHKEKKLGRLRRADAEGELGTSARQWYDVEAGRWCDYPIPDGAIVEVMGEHVVHVAKHYAADIDPLLCEVCHHSKECDATRGGEHGPEVDFATHHCPGV